MVIYVNFPDPKIVIYDKNNSDCNKTDVKTLKNDLKMVELRATLSKVAGKAKNINNSKFLLIQIKKDFFYR